MRHDPRPRRGLTVVEIVLVIALVVLPVTLVVILFGKDIKRWVGSTFGSARSESQNLYRDRTAKGIGAVKTGTGSGAAAASDAGGGSAGDPVQVSSKAPSGGTVAGQVETSSSEPESKPSAALAILAVAVALVAALAATRKR